MRTKKFLSGLALGAVIGSALGLFLSPGKGKQNQEKFKKVSKQLSGKLIKEVAAIKAIDREKYENVVKKLISKYSKEDLLTKDAWEEIGKELIARWHDIQQELKKNKKK